MNWISEHFKPILLDAYNEACRKELTPVVARVFVYDKALGELMRIESEIPYELDEKVVDYVSGWIDGFFHEKIKEA